MKPQEKQTHGVKGLADVLWHFVLIPYYCFQLRIDFKQAPWAWGDRKKFNLTCPRILQRACSQARLLIAVLQFNLQRFNANYAQLAERS